ncbi:MAG: HIRAN domain-containing protein [Desulfuromonadales bacterium]|nr:HIRAN domain-containing protein [Desulfuromonadales bacterium]
MKKLYLAWQDTKTRTWFTVGMLTFEEGLYQFVYTKGAEVSRNFLPFGRMQDLHATYLSEELFPLFANRILTASRPEYNDYIQWLNLDLRTNNVFEMLALTGGTRGTDSLEMYSCPERDSNGQYSVDFFCHGLRHLPEESLERVNSLSVGEKLFVMKDVQNPFDKLALSLRTDDPAMMVGYCPRYLAEDFNDYLDDDPALVDVSVLKVNAAAPAQMRLMCRMKAPWVENHEPCTSEQYQPLTI